MIYIKLEEKDEKNIKRSRFSKFIDKIKGKTAKIKEDKFEDKILISLPNIENKTLNKLSSYMQQNCINRVCISNELLSNPVFMEFIKNKNVRIFDGRWLFKELVPKCVDYIIICKKDKMEYQEVSILSKDISQIVVYNIKELSGKVRILNIITENENKFRKLERELYEQNGIILNMNNNYKKSLAKSDIIINFDFSEEEINKYTLPKKSCIINLKEEVQINSKAFEGINVSFYEIQIPRKYIKNLLYFKGFDTSMLYESFIYKNTNPNNIKSELIEDGINISFLNGKNGKIRKTEYANLSKKLVN